VSNLGTAVVSGEVQSPDFPVTDDAYDTSFNGGLGDLFVTEFSVNGDTLLYSTFLGGSDNDYFGRVVLDTQGSVYVVGSTFSFDFPVTADAYDPAHAGTDITKDVVIAKFSPDRISLAYGTFLGGSEDETAPAVVLDPQENLILAGGTNSGDFPVTPDAFDPAYSGGDYGYDAFVVFFELPNQYGDLNCDGAINGYDIDPFVLALTSAPDFAAYYAVYPGCDGMLADCSGDGGVNGFDIDPFVQLLTGRSTASSRLDN
jgi:hypothetical protein